MCFGGGERMMWCVQLPVSAFWNAHRIFSSEFITPVLFRVSQCTFLYVRGALKSWLKSGSSYHICLLTFSENAFFWKNVYGLSFIDSIKKKKSSYVTLEERNLLWLIRENLTEDRRPGSVCLSPAGKCFTQDQVPKSSMMITYICVSNEFHCSVVSLSLMYFLLLLGENIKGMNIVSSAGRV